jgi:ribosomal protein L16 Arg81 hydroxylase
LIYDFGSSKWQAQIYGRKRWIMHPPEQSALLYNGLVDPFLPDLQRFPKYAEATPLDFVLEPGEVVVWSAGWWHATLALEDSLAIAQNLLNEHNYEEFRRTSQKACRPSIPGILVSLTRTVPGTVLPVYYSISILY